jgi:HEAT repeat protein
MSSLVPIRLAGFLAVLGMAVLAVPSARADYSPDQLKADLKLLEDAKQPHSDADLLDFFRKRMVDSEAINRIEKLITKLSSMSLKDRDAAKAELIKVGPPALPLLRKVMNGTVDLEMRLRCDRCVKEIEKKSPNTIVTAAARLLKARQAPGACAVLLEYVAVAPDDIVQEEVYASIYHLALAGAKLEVFPPLVKAGKLDPVLVQALNDKEAVRRAIAALIVGQFGTDLQRKVVKGLLADNDAEVRFRAAQGLLAARDQSGMPVLVELLHKGPFNVALQAEDLLGLTAQEKGPVAPLADTAEARQKCHDAWQAWWEKNKGSLDLTKLELDSPFGGLSARAGATAVLFINAIIKFDAAQITKTTDVPFSLAGVITFNTREEFDKFIEMAKGGGGPENIKFKVGKVVSAAEYLKVTSEQERSFLEASRPAQVHIVYVDLLEGPGGGRQEALTVFIRISGGRAKCIGIGGQR